MKVLIVVLIRDYAEEKCIESLEHQTFPNCEILVHKLASEYLDDDSFKNKIKNIAKHRAIVQQIALKSDATHFMLVDSDTVLPYNTVELLLSANKDIISAWCPMVYDTRWIGGYEVEGRFHNFMKPEPGIIEADMVPIGCMLITREAYEKAEWNGGAVETVRGPYGNSMLAGGTYVFCKKIKAKGYKLYLHGDLIATHLEKSQLVNNKKMGTEINQPAVTNFAQERIDPNILIRRFCEEQGIDITLVAESIPVKDGSVIIRPGYIASYKPRI